MILMRKIIIIISLSLLLFSCTHKQDKKQNDQPKQTLEAPAFNSDSAFSFVKAQTDFDHVFLTVRLTTDARHG